MTRIFGHAQVFSPDGPEAENYYFMIFVFFTSEGPFWSADNVSKAIFNVSNKIKGSIKDYELEEYAKMHVALDGTRWLRWNVLEKELIRLCPDVDHRLAWWCGRDE